MKNQSENPYLVTSTTYCIFYNVCINYKLAFSCCLCLDWAQSGYLVVDQHIYAIKETVREPKIRIIGRPLSVSPTVAQRVDVHLSLKCTLNGFSDFEILFRVCPCAPHSPQRISRINFVFKDRGDLQLYHKNITCICNPVSKKRWDTE